MSRRHLERALFELGHDTPLTREARTTDEALTTLVEETDRALRADPLHRFPSFDLDEDERAAIRDVDVATLHRWGVHGNLLRNFAAIWKVDIRARYREAGL
ncbi:hypothetical protein HX744_25945 [Pseudonocardia sp. ICBG1122]|nr:hypothetical protein [Pseudonocardia pini]